MRIIKVANSEALYHGSDSEKFEGDIRLNERDSGWFGSGFYLTRYTSYAKRWGKFIYRAEIQVGKMAEVNCPDGYKNIEYIGDANIANENAGGDSAWMAKEWKWSQSFKKSLLKMGYDGVRVHMDGYKDAEVLVFDPSKVKVLGRLEEENDQVETTERENGTNSE